MVGDRCYRHILPVADFLLGVFFNPEEKNNMFLRNVG
jgi:hypothetical protein